MNEHETTAVTRLVDKARTPAQDFLKAVGVILSRGDYTLDAYGVESANWQGERESASIKLDANTTLTVQLTRAK